MSNKTYDYIKIFCSIILPALGVFFAAVSDLWKIPNGELITGTILAVTAMANTVVNGISKYYHKNIQESDEND